MAWRLVTAGDSRVCPLCRRNENLIVRRKKDLDMLPLHPGCRCFWLHSGQRQKRPTWRDPLFYLTRPESSPFNPELFVNGEWWPSSTIERIQIMPYLEYPSVKKTIRVVAAPSWRKNFGFVKTLKIRVNGGHLRSRQKYQHWTLCARVGIIDSKGKSIIKKFGVKWTRANERYTGDTTIEVLDKLSTGLININIELFYDFSCYYSIPKTRKFFTDLTNMPDYGYGFHPPKEFKLTGEWIYDEGWLFRLTWTKLPLLPRGTYIGYYVQKAIPFGRSGRYWKTLNPKFVIAGKGWLAQFGGWAKPIEDALWQIGDLIGADRTKMLLPLPTIGTTWDLPLALTGEKYRVVALDFRTHYLTSDWDRITDILEVGKIPKEKIDEVFRKKRIPSIIHVPIPVPNEPWYKEGKVYEICGEIYTYKELFSLSLLVEEGIGDTISLWVEAGHPPTLKKWITERYGR